MPRFDFTGQWIAAGMAGGTVSVGRLAEAMQAIATPAGGAVWYGDRVIYQHCLVERGTEQCRIMAARPGQKPSVLDEGGAVALAGGRAHYALDASSGIRGSVNIPGAALKDMGPDGTLAYCRSRRDGLGLVLRAPTGHTRVLVTDRPVSDVQVLGPAEAIWIDGQRGGRIAGTVRLPRVPDGRCFAPRRAVVAGRAWWLYGHIDAVGWRLILQPENADRRGIVVTTGDAHRPDLAVVDGQLRVCWSLTEGEGPQAIRERTIHPSEALAPLTRAAAPTPTPAPTPAPTPEPTPMPVATDEIDLSHVTFLHTDVRDWPITSRLTDLDLPEPGKRGVRCAHTKAGKWPVSEGSEGVLWILAQIGGRWYAATCEWLRPGQTWKPALGADNIGASTKVHPLAREIRPKEWVSIWTPQPGEIVGLMVSTTGGRDKARHTVPERSQVVRVIWPGTVQPSPQPEPVPVPTPEPAPGPTPEPAPTPPPACDLSALSARLDLLREDYELLSDAYMAVSQELAEVRKVCEAERPIEINAGWLGTLRGMVGRPKA